MNKKSFILLPIILFVCMLGGIFIGIDYARGHRTYPVDNKLATILEYINERYVDTVDVNELVERAIPSVISGLDPHSTYFSAKEMKLNGEELSGHFGGIGVRFMLHKDSIIVVNVVKGGPSEAIGIKAGDRIVFVNDSLMAGKTITNEKVLTTLKGKEGTSVKIGVKRAGEKDILKFIVIRGEIPEKSVVASFMASDKIGYIKVSQFGGTTYQEFSESLADLKEQGAKSYIVDLRGNLGGYLKAAIDMINEFLDKKELIVYTKGKDSPRSNSYATGKGMYKDSPLAVLIDESSCSASEIFSGAMQDNDRALIIGRRSFGKGLVQEQVPFSDGSALRLTIARYYTPSGRCIQKAYKLGDQADYRKDLENRWLRGEMDSRDSIKMKGFPLFHTNAGRPVYGNDGIMPDVFIPRDTTGFNSYYISLSVKGILREYTFMYSDSNRKKLSTFKTWEELDQYLKKQPLVENLVAYASTKKIRPRPLLIEECRPLLQNYLESAIVNDLFENDGFYQIATRDDIVYKEAIRLINEGEASKESIEKREYKSVDLPQKEK